MASVLVRGKFRQRHRHTKGKQRADKAEIGGGVSANQETWRIVGNPWKLGRSKKGFFSRVFRGGIA